MIHYFFMLFFSPGEEKGHLLQYSGLESSMDWELDTAEWLSLYAFLSGEVGVAGGGLKPPTCHWVKAICLAFNITLCSCDTFSSQQLKVLNTYQPIILTTAQLERADSK